MGNAEYMGDNTFLIFVYLIYTILLIIIILH